MESLDVIPVQGLILKTAYFMSVTQLESTRIHLHVKQDTHFKQLLKLDVNFEVITWLKFGSSETLPIKEKDPRANLFQSYLLQKLEDFSGLLLQLLILH